MSPASTSPVTAAADSLVEIWMAPVDEHLRAADWLDADEEAHHARLHVAADRGRFLASRVLLRSALSRIAPVAPQAWRFARQATGAWRIVAPLDASPPAFSIAHTASVAVVALVGGGGAAVGIDVERLEPRQGALAIDVALTAAERAELAALPAELQGRAQLEIWTAKEAYAKLVGLGAALDFATLDIARAPLRLRAIHALSLAPEDLDRVHLEAREIAIGGTPHLVTIATHRPANGAVRTRWHLAESPRL